MKSTIWSESARTPRQSDLMLAGGCRTISRHSAARSTTRITSRISVVSRTAPAMRDFWTRAPISIRAEKSKRPPTRRNSRISLASSCWLSIQSRSVEGASSGDALLAERRRGVSAQEFAQGVELEHARRTVSEISGHRISCYRSAARRGRGKEKCRARIKNKSKSLLTAKVAEISRRSRRKSKTLSPRTRLRLALPVLRLRGTSLRKARRLRACSGR